jgi:hypothetical protein
LRSRRILVIRDHIAFSLPAHKGRLDEARAIVERQRAITSIVIPDASYLWKAEHGGLFLSGLRLAMRDTT